MVGGLGSKFLVQCSTLINVVLLKTGNRLLDVAPFVLVIVLQEEHRDARGGWVVNSSKFQVQCFMLINVVLMKTGNGYYTVCVGCCVVLIAGGALGCT